MKKVLRIPSRQNNWSYRRARTDYSRVGRRKPAKSPTREAAAIILPSCQAGSAGRRVTPIRGQRRQLRMRRNTRSESAAPYGGEVGAQVGHPRTQVGRVFSHGSRSRRTTLYSKPVVHICICGSQRAEPVTSFWHEWLTGSWSPSRTLLACEAQRKLDSCPSTNPIRGRASSMGALAWRTYDPSVRRVAEQIFAMNSLHASA